MKEWESIAEAKRKKVYESIPKEWRLSSVPSADELGNVREYLNGSLPPDEVEIAESTIGELSARISQGELSSYEVIRVFSRRAAIAHQLVNCCSEIFFDRGFERAKELDAYYKKHGKVVGPLHGIPISFKDQVNLEGIPSAIGYVGRTNEAKIREEVSLLAEILEGLGAIFFVKTTVPMALMSGDTYSNIYGQTFNACNRKLSPGGSSGGEGALLASRGASIGFGTDIGGSIRYPSVAQGLFGLRCSSNRLPYWNITNSMADQPILCSVVGPMCTDIDDLKAVVKHTLYTEPWKHDPKCPPIPWREYETPQKLSYGLFDFSEYTYLHPPVKRAIEIVKRALVEKGHEWVLLEKPIPPNAYPNLMNRIFEADGSKEIIGECAKTGEPVLVMVDSEGKPSPPVKDVNEHWDHGRLKYRYQKTFDDYILSTDSKTSTGRPVDGLIVPLQPHVSFRPGDFRKFKANFAEMFNVLDYPVMLTPILKVDKTIDKKENGYSPLNEYDQILYEYYDPDLFHGTPVGLQVAAPRYCEETAIALSKEIIESLK